MTSLTILTTAMLALAAPAVAAGNHGGDHGTEMAVGMPGDDVKVDRTVEFFDGRDRGCRDALRAARPVLLQG